MGKKWLGLLVLFVAALWFASHYGGNIPYMLLKFVIAIPVIAGLYTLWVTEHFKFYQRIGQQTIVKGEPVDYYFCITNEDRFFYDNIAVEFMQENSRLLGITGQLDYHLLPGEEKEVTTKICCNYRGEYAVGACRFLISDYLHLIAMPYSVKAPLKVLVLPRVTAWRYEQEVLDQSNGKNIGANCASGELDVQVRNYSTGDSMRQIHWKAAAKAGKLMSREQYENRKQELVLFLDLIKIEGSELDQLQYEDEVIEQAVGAVHACLKRHIPCTIIFDHHGCKSCHIESELQWQQFYQLFGTIRFEAQKGIAELPIDKKLLSDLKYAVFLTSHLDSALYDRMCREFAGIETSVVTISLQKNSKEDSLGFIAKNGVSVYRTYLDSQIAR